MAKKWTEGIKNISIIAEYFKKIFGSCAQSDLTRENTSNTRCTKYTDMQPKPASTNVRHTL